APKGRHSHRPPPHALPRHLHPPPVADQRPGAGAFRDGEEADGARLGSVQRFQAEGPGTGIQAAGAADPEDGLSTLQTVSGTEVVRVQRSPRQDDARLGEEAEEPPPEPFHCGSPVDAAESLSRANRSSTASATASFSKRRRRSSPESSSSIR